MHLTFIYSPDSFSLMNTSSKFHLFHSSISDIPLPDKFTFPFHYTPHPLCILAVNQTITYIESQVQWHSELQKGKMFGVMVVRNNNREIGFIAAFSGNLEHSNNHNYFVPPVYDLLNPEGYFKEEEKKISDLNTDILQIEKNEEYLLLQKKYSDIQAQAKETMAQARLELKEAKIRREARRQETISDLESAQMIRESQFQKAEFKRL
ncbi:MAG: hypothetical protein ACRCSQ_09225 [Bacteroidales bacterium]